MATVRDSGGGTWRAISPGRHGGMIPLVMLLTAAVALALTLVQAPEYRATAMLNVWPSQLMLDSQQTVQGLMKNYAGAITSRETAVEVIDRLQLDLVPDQLRAQLTVETDEQELTLRIQADDYDPLIAQSIAQTAAQVFIEQNRVRMLAEEKADRVEVNLRESAAPGRVHKPKWQVNVLAAAVFGALAGWAAAYGLNRLESEIIRTSQDLARSTGLSVLGAIPR
jgi:capsular polysaccharide biosynthesis protein